MDLQCTITILVVIAYPRYKRLLPCFLVEERDGLHEMYGHKGMTDSGGHFPSDVAQLGNGLFSFGVKKKATHPHFY